MHELLHEPTRLLIAAAIVCFVFWVAGRLKKASALVDDILRPGDAVASVEDGTTPSLAVWRGMSTDQQEAHDTEVLDRAEQAELDARADAEEAAQVFLAQAVKTNALHHP